MFITGHPVVSNGTSTTTTVDRNMLTPLSSAVKQTRNNTCCSEHFFTFGPSVCSVSCCCVCPAAKGYTLSRTDSQNGPRFSPALIPNVGSGPSNLTPNTHSNSHCVKYVVCKMKKLAVFDNKRKRVHNKENKQLQTQNAIYLSKFF